MRTAIGVRGIIIARVPDQSVFDPRDAAVARTQLSQLAVVGVERLADAIETKQFTAGDSNNIGRSGTDRPATRLSGRFSHFQGGDHYATSEQNAVRPDKVPQGAGSEK